MDWVLISVGFYLGMRVFGQDWASPSYHVDVLVSLCFLGVLDVVDYTSMSLVIDYTPSTVVCATSTNASWNNSSQSWFSVLLPKMPNSFHQL